MAIDQTTNQCNASEQKKDPSVSKKKKSKIGTYDLEMVCSEFNRILRQLIENAISKDPKNANIDDIKRKVQAGIKSNPDEVLSRAAPKFLVFAEAIIKKDKKTFMDKSIDRKYIKNDEDKSRNLGLIRAVRKMIKKATEDEEKLLWKQMKKMLQICSRYLVLKRTGALVV
jgi:hypothetical protein